jgi:hypothetical protein
MHVFSCCDKGEYTIYNYDSDGTENPLPFFDFAQRWVHIACLRDAVVVGPSMAFHLVAAVGV